MATVKVPSPVMYKDLTDQQIAKIQKKLIYQAKADEYFDQFTEHEAWERGSKTMRVRKLILPIVKASEVAATQENVAPRPTKMAYATFQFAVENYDDRVDYTRESALYNFDDVVRDAGDTLSYKFTQKLDYIKGKPFVSSKALLTYDTSLIKTMRKAKIILQKNKAKPYKDGKYLMIASPEIINLLTDELETKGVALPEETKTDIINSTIYSKYGFIISECPSDILQNSDTTTHMVIFMGRTQEGRLPVTTRTMGDVEVYNDGLGSGIMLDEDGKVTNDANRQKGDVAMSALGLGAHIADDLCILDCKVTVATIAKTELAESARTGYVSTSSSPADEE